MRTASRSYNVPLPYTPPVYPEPQDAAEPRASTSTEDTLDAESEGTEEEFADALDRGDMEVLYPPQNLAGRGRVVTLGMFIIDHFEVTDEQGRAVPADEEAIGGGGIYATSAARLFLPPSHVGFIADAGDDFPPTFREALGDLGDGVVWLRKRDGPTTRAVNIYSGPTVGDGHQSFKYLTPRLQIFPRDYLNFISPFATPPPEWMHVVCDVHRAPAILDDAQGYRAKGWEGGMAWEPLIRGGEEQEDMLMTYVKLAKRFEIFSPNHLELQTILEERTADVETCARLFHGYMAASGGPVPAIVVRAGADGAFTLAAEWTGWVPAYWQGGEGVVDVTGGGNAFMGGLLAGLMISLGDMRVASIYAATAASFAIQQRGIPHHDGDGLWNGVSPWDRLREMAERVPVDD